MLFLASSRFSRTAYSHELARLSSRRGNPQSKRGKKEWSSFSLVVRVNSCKIITMRKISTQPAWNDNDPKYLNLNSPVLRLIQKTWAAAQRFPRPTSKFPKWRRTSRTAADRVVSRAGLLLFRQTKHTAVRAPQAWRRGSAPPWLWRSGPTSRQLGEGGLPPAQVSL